MKPEPRIVCAANRYGDIIVASARHFDSLMRSQIDALDLGYCGDEEQGFIDQFCNFYSREEALEIAIKNNQIKSGETIRHGQLFSENLY